MDHLKAKGRSVYINHHEVYRPWGTHDISNNCTRYKVKRITVKSGAKLSVQKHHHHVEHWIVINGTAKVTNGGSTYLVAKNELTYIPKVQVLGELRQDRLGNDRGA